MQPTECGPSPGPHPLHLALLPPPPPASTSVRRRIAPPSSGPLRVPASRAFSSTSWPDPGKPRPSRHLAGRRLILLAVNCRFLARPDSSRLLPSLCPGQLPPLVAEPSFESAISSRALVEAAARIYNFCIFPPLKNHFAASCRYRFTSSEICVGKGRKLYIIGAVKCKAKPISVLC